LVLELSSIVESAWASTGTLARLTGAGARVVRSAGFVERLSLERAAGAIVTDSLRVREEALVLGVSSYRVGPEASPVPASTGDFTVDLGTDRWALAGVRLQPNPPTPCAVPLWDGRAGSRAADVIVSNFARTRLA
jgi:hypothetical protein